MTTDLIARLEDALPQTQCRQCGFTGCTEYARAIAAGTPINRCPPGGAAGIRALAAVTGRPELPLDPEYGTEAPFGEPVIDASLVFSEPAMFSLGIFSINGKLASFFQPIENLEFLVFFQRRNHLQMSLIGFRNDTEGHTILHLLYLLL